MAKIFISYARDKSYGQQLAAEAQMHLQCAGFEVFRDVIGLRPGDVWYHKLELELESSDSVLLIVSEKIRTSKWVHNEVSMAEEIGLPVIPVFAEKVRSPLWLRHLHAFYFFDEPAWGALIEVLRGCASEQKYEAPSLDAPKPSIDSAFETLLSPHLNIPSYDRRVLEAADFKGESTDLLSRKKFEVEVSKAIDESEKSGMIYVLLMISVDQAEMLNRTLGYDVCDLAINDFVGILKEVISKGKENLLSQLADNRFGILFKKTSLVSAANKMKAIRLAVADYKFNWNDKSLSLSLSGGFVVGKKDDSSSSQMITNSDIARQIASNKGGNRIVAYRSDDLEIKKDQNRMECLWELNLAFKENNFELFAQPIYPLEKGRISFAFNRYELMVRMPRGSGEYLSPSEFLSTAEYFSMMPDLDRWVVREAFKFISRLKSTGSSLVFSINLSGQSLDEASFLDFILAEIETTKVNPSMLCFEITETIAVNDLELMGRFIRTLKDLGSSFSLDNFGTGVSSYGYLTSLDVDFLKISGIYIKDFFTDPIARNIVESVSQVSKSLNLKVVAIDVEDLVSISLLADIGLDYAQGDCISKPRPLRQMLKKYLPVSFKH